MLDDSSKVADVEVTINVLCEALQHLNDHDYASAQTMIAIARQLLEDLQLDFDRHFQVEEMLKQLLSQSPKWPK